MVPLALRAFPMSHLLLVGVFALSSLSPLMAQKSPKIDSLLVVIPAPKGEAMDQVLAAFAAAGLEVTDNSGSLVSSDVGGSTNILGTKYTRSVRALLTGSGGSTTVLLHGEEFRSDNKGFTKRLRIDNRAGGNGKKVWNQMLTVAHTLESAWGSRDGSDQPRPQASDSSPEPMAGYESETVHPEESSPFATPADSTSARSSQARSKSTTLSDARANQQPSPARTQQRSPAHGRLNGELLRDPELRQALDDMVRIGIGTEYQEVRWGVLRLMIGAAYKGSAATYYLNRLWTAYMLASNQDGTVVIELWQGDRKLGEFAKDGLLVGPEFSAPR